MNRYFAAVALLVLAAGNIAVSAAPVEAYGRPEVVSSMAVSPDGDRVAFRREDGTMNAVFIVNVEAGEIVGAVDGSETHIRQVEFLNQDRLVLLAEETGHVNLGRTVARRVHVSTGYIYDQPTNQLHELVEDRRHLYPNQQGFGRIVGYSPARDAVYMPAFVGQLNSTPPTYGLLEVTVDDPDGTVLSRGTSDTVDWFVDDGGRILAEEEYDYKRHVQNIWRRRDDDRELIHSSGDGGPIYNVVGLSHDFASLIVSARSAGSEYYSYFQMDLDDGSLSPPLFEKEGVSVERALVDGSRRVFGVEYAGFFPSYEFLDPALTRRVQDIQTSLGSVAAYLVDWTPGFDYMVFRLTGGWTSGMYVLVGPDSDKPSVLATIHPDIPGEAVAPTSVIHYEARDGLEIPALVTARAEVREAGNAPLIVVPHGGPEAHDRFGFDWFTQYFAARGIVVLQPQFRGSTGFGVKLRSAAMGEWGAAMLTDLDDGVEKLISEGLVDPNRVCMVGMSYGGYAALASGAFSSFDYKCLAAISGISDLPRMLVTNRELYGDDSRVVRYWQAQFGSERKSDRTLESASPVNFAKNFSAPVLLVHGRKDAVVPLDQSLRMEKALKRAKKPVELVRLDGEDHYLSGYETRLAALKAVAEFIEENL